MKSLINEKTLRRLEFDKIIALLEGLASSVEGKELAKALYPDTDYNKIQESLSETSEAKGILRLEPGFTLGGVKDLRGLMKRVQIGAVLEPSQLLEVYSTLYAARRAKTFIVNRKGDYPIIKALGEALQILTKVEQEINQAITDSGEVADKASPELASIRKQMNTKQLRIKEKLEHIIRSNQYQKMLQEAIITIRGDRYVVPVKQEYRAQFSGVVHDQSASGATLFIEPMAVVELNNDLRSLAINEKVEIDRILKYLSNLVSANIDILESNSKLLARLDFIFAKAALSHKMEAGEAKLNKNHSLYINQGRHPLIPGKAVPTTIYLGKDFDTLLITGPNTGGKTVTLKTVGLFALMTQAGLHIPAELGTEMPIFNQIFSDIGDEQSIEQSLSTFSSHMTNIINILHNVSANDLVLMDELGAGTDPTEGAALAIAILEELIERKVKTIATTHYSELKNFAYSKERVENASVEFDIQTLRPTYKLIIGQPGKSNAFEIAGKLGLSTKIINRGKEFMSQEEIKVSDLLENLEDNRRQAEKEKEEAIQLREEIERLKEDYQRRQVLLEEKKRKILDKAQEEAYEVIRSARRESEEIIKELKQTLAEESEATKIRAIEEAKLKLKTISGKVEKKLGNRSEAPVANAPKKVSPGEAIFIPKLNQKGHVVEVNQNGDILVQVGIMKITVKLKEIQLVANDKEAEGRTSFKTITTSKALGIKNEIDLRGMTVDEAMLEAEKFIDDAYLAGLSPIYLIHGKGTGVLRSAMQSMLKVNKQVKSYRFGQYGEGGAGVTVVDLK